MPSNKKPFKDDKTIVSAEFLTSIFGGSDGYSSASPPSPFYKGHIHDDGSTWGHAPKIDLTDNVSGRLVSPTLELKSIALAATQGTPLTSSLFWTLPIPADAYSTLPQLDATNSMFLKIFWSGNNVLSVGNAAFRVDWEYIRPGNNIMPPSILHLGSDFWPANTDGASNPEVNTMRFKVNATPSKLYVNDALNNSKYIKLTLPTGSSLADFLMLGLEITTAPTVTLNFPMSQINIFAVELMYYSQTLGTNSTLTILETDAGLADY